ncbi:MAG: 2OG-Fe(II) oxygenase [Sphingomonas sp.]|nr:2OG-Fe(II) oxygenase [Sphingomonas sp.]
MVRGQSLAFNPMSATGEVDFAQAMAILSGRASAAEAVQAEALLIRAISQRHASAANRLALVRALGVTSPPDWEGALDALASGAEYGDRQCRDQLQLLAAPDQTPVPDDQDWTALRAQVDLAERLAAPAAARISESPYLRAHAGIISKAECAWLIEAALPRLSAVMVFDQRGGSQARHFDRDNSAICYQIAELDFLAEVVRARISGATRVPVPFFEPPQILRYQPGQRFKLHADYFDPAIDGYRDEIAARGQRVGTFLIYLNDDYVAGETEFPEAGIKWRGKAGDGLFFANVDRAGQPDRRAVHAGLPPNGGDKWIFSQWIRDRVPA